MAIVVANSDREELNHESVSVYFTYFSILKIIYQLYKNCMVLYKSYLR